MLSTDDAAVWAHVIGAPDEDLETYPLTFPGVTTTEHVARMCGLGPGRWRVSLYPVPQDNARKVVDWPAVQVVHGATVTFTPADADDQDIIVLG